MDSGNSRVASGEGRGRSRAHSCPQPPAVSKGGSGTKQWQRAGDGGGSIGTNPHFDRLAAAGDGPAGQQARSGGAEPQASECLTGQQTGTTYWRAKGIVVYDEIRGEAWKVDCSAGIACKAYGSTAPKARGTVNQAPGISSRAGDVSW